MTSVGLGVGRGFRVSARWAALTLGAGVLANCVEPLPPFVEGSLYVTVATTGGDLDLDGYVLSLDGAQVSRVDPNQDVLLENLSVGTHTVELSGVADNCAVTAENPRTVTVQDGATIDASFEVACAVTGVWLVITTTGVDLPPHYLIAVDGRPALTVPPNSSALVSRLGPGSHTAVLTSPTSNCTVAGSDAVEVTLSSGEMAVVSFQVSCEYGSGSIAVTASTSGLDVPDAGYDIRLDGDVIASIDVNARTFLDASAGDHAVELDNIPNNCTVQGANPVTASVTTGGMTRDTADVAFALTCVTMGSIAVHTTVSGLDGPRRDYGIAVDGSLVDSVSAVGSRVIDGFAAGDHSVELTQVPSNCVVAGANPVTVSVTTGVLTRDTTNVTFDVACSRVWDLAFTRITARGLGEAAAMHVARADGSDPTFLTWGSEGEWSPDGTQITFSACTWFDDYDYYYYEPICYPIGLRIASTQSTALIALTSNRADAEPSWRPDGSRIAFASAGRLHLIDPDGSDRVLVPLPDEVHMARQPAWSPDGSTLAFTCEVEAANLDICSVRPDGTAFARLTNTFVSEAGPAWKPDGSMIAYTASPSGSPARIELIQPNGSGHTVLPIGTIGMDAVRPAWSSDGAALTFVGLQCSLYSGCSSVGILRVNADGTGLTQLTSGPDDHPAWRP